MDNFATVYIIYMRILLRWKAGILRSHSKRNHTRREQFWIKMYKIFTQKIIYLQSSQFICCCKYAACSSVAVTS